MYTGNEKNPVQQIEIIKKNSRQKSSLLDTLIHHALLPMTILFMAIDALTIAYTRRTFLTNVWSSPGRSAGFLHLSSTSALRLPVHSLRITATC